MLTKDSNSYVSNEKQINYYVVSFQGVNSHFAGHSLLLKNSVALVAISFARKFLCNCDFANYNQCFKHVYVVEVICRNSLHLQQYRQQPLPKSCSISQEREQTSCT